MKKLLVIGLFLCSLNFFLGAIHAKALDLGDGKFVFIGSVTEEKGDYVIREGEREYRLSIAQLKGTNPGSILANLVKNDKSGRFSGSWIGSGAKRELNPASLKIEVINGEADCPEKIFSTNSITGTFMGTDCGDFCYTTIRDKNGRELTMYGDTEEIFGSKEGVKVSAEYQTAQTWLDTGDWGMCVIGDFFKSGKRIK